MNMADRIEYLRKTNGISQEELADKVGVSRQAVSKWENEQSLPDLEKIITMSDYFGVTTDYILKGIEPVADKEQKSSELTSKILYIASTAFVAIGLFSAFSGWHETQTIDTIWGSMIIQAVGIAGYFIGRLLSAARPAFAVNWLNLSGFLFMPFSMVTGAISIALFKQGWIAPYPIGIAHVVLFAIVYISICAISFIVLKRRTTGVLV
ncbi:helix-turn-helix domain-containing protein [Streptococcus ruminantium]|uniref:Helix-turn-helix transcriptional regulator n=1 Tax=Streptococcus ruminantium TaxID=1917441 RepID=A0A2Z5TNQ6_9STRE|nr:helix-turn-helix transcriptional regulator [Streptococcus ruminantium]MDQ8759429.1 helix-turn-helix transcriptional regulator [Streptococcus ruminantium]MDQ8764993.1 helix-turn-helix transcriptional regulator [Streptococcus ruminantium]MDQ8769510.1 helix-turn-helix transcriptional regulator [Streptococcus ruminantium]MDQ8775309.1 helix-turn-helix transcriptional regulator [Streptococcus ruminantium]MDQ8793518.1 helix-turn-helix transcriptional regulator [Streptococcus ruminantium]